MTRAFSGEGSIAASRREAMAAAFRAAFGGDPEIWVRAPGRVDLMGSHTDYNAGCVMTQTIDRDTWIAARAREDGRVNAASMNIAGIERFAVGESAAATEARCTGWGLYLEGVAMVLAQAGHPVRGADVVVHGNVPVASGLSSSASLEVAAATLFEQLGGFELEPLEKARLCQRAENEIVGVACGILDQYSAVFGERDRVLVLDCRNDTHGYSAYPEGLCTVVCNTAAPRELGGSQYALRRRQCEQAARHFAALDPALRSLRDVPEALFASHRGELPEDVARRAEFIIQENARVGALAAALARNDHAAIRRLMAASYTGARDLFEIGIPAMETMLRAMEAGPGVVGARQAGAGFGGCMVALVRSEEVAVFCEQVAHGYRKDTGITPDVYAVRTAPGAGIVRDGV